MITKRGNKRTSHLFLKRTGAQYTYFTTTKTTQQKEKKS